jgi:hypothetical protein
MESKATRQLLRRVSLGPREPRPNIKLRKLFAAKLKSRIKTVTALRSNGLSRAGRQLWSLSSSTDRRGPGQLSKSCCKSFNNAVSKSNKPRRRTLPPPQGKVNNCCEGKRPACRFRRQIHRSGARVDHAAGIAVGGAKQTLRPLEPLRFRAQPKRGNVGLSGGRDTPDTVSRVCLTITV